MGIEHIELTDRIYAQVKQMIFDQYLMPGQKILQEKLSADLGVSRTPLLKALHRLESEMLVESIPRRGLFVKKMSKQEMIDIFECRSVIEGLSARLAAQRLSAAELQKVTQIFQPFTQQTGKLNVEEYAKRDREFHNTLLELSGNKVIPRLEMLSNIHLFAFQVGLVRPPEETLPEHLAIVDALQRHDAEAAETRMRAHIIKSLESLKAKD